LPTIILDVNWCQICVKVYLEGTLSSWICPWQTVGHLYRLLFWEQAAPWMLPYTKASYCVIGGRSIVVSKAGRRNGGRGFGRGIFLVFSLFPMCSHQIPKGFLKSPSCSSRYSQEHLRFLPYDLPKV
jgi:hypothetical protein